MTAIAALTINDGATTPVAHTFSPVNIDAAGVARWADRVGGIALGFPVLSYSLRPPTKESRVYKLTLKVVVPTLEITSPSTATGIQPQPTKAFDLTFNGDYTMAERSTTQQRKDFFAFVKNFQANAVVTAGIENFESVY